MRTIPERMRILHSVVASIACSYAIACSSVSPSAAGRRPVVVRLDEEPVALPEPAEDASSSPPQSVGETHPQPEPHTIEPPPLPIEDPLPVPGPDEVLILRDGAPAGVILRSRIARAGLQLLELGTAWVPPLFRSTPEYPNDYAPVFIALENGEYPEDPEGRRAAQERYLEPHGIPPSPALLEHRFVWLARQPCSTQLALEPLRAFEGAAWDEYDAVPPAVPDAVLRALQARLACEGHLREPPSGALDAATRAALEEFERRNRIYARGALHGATLEALGTAPLELERRTLVRVLTERAVLDLAVIEDGSGSAADVVGQVETHVRDALGLQTLAGVERFYARLGEQLDRPNFAIAIDVGELPEYYASDMDLWVEIDRGDLYYEFPFDENGELRDFELDRVPTLTLFTRAVGVVSTLAMYPTTIGGWRVRHHGDSYFWEYKGSPTGLSAWRRIVTAPVWLPPRSTPPETLVARLRRTSDGSEFFELNYNLVGPSFASAYGLVAAYHQPVRSKRRGELVLGRDRGIRTHGTSDYTSIGRTVSSGCHRLYNHEAMRLFNFVLAHRAHRRAGHRPLNYDLAVDTAELQAQLHVSETGYEYDLVRPIEVRVLPGRVRGALQDPSAQRIPAAADPADRPRVLFDPSAAFCGEFGTACEPFSEGND